MAVSAAVIVALVLTGGLVFVIPEWAQRARSGASSRRQRQLTDVDSQLARIDAETFEARHGVVTAREQQRRMELLLRETKKMERDRTQRLRLEQRESEKARRRQMRQDEYQRAAARRRGRLSASTVLALGIAAAIVGGTALRATAWSVWLIVGGVVLAALGVWALSRIEQVAAARREAIARGEGVFIGEDSATDVAVDGADNARVVVDREGMAGDGAVAHDVAAEASAEAARREAARAQDHTWQPTALPAPLGTLTHATARQAAFAEAARFAAEAQRTKDALAAESGASASAGAGADEAAADGVAEPNVAAQSAAPSAADAQRAELQAASDASIEALRQAHAEPEVAELAQRRDDEDEVAPLRGAALDAILQHRRRG